MEKLKKYLEQSVYDVIKKYDGKLLEIRLRIHSPIILQLIDDECILTGFIVSEEMLECVIEKITHYSLYAYEREFRDGYLTVEGGHRIGFAGEGIYQQSKLVGMKNISFMNIRICHPGIEWNEELLWHLTEGNRVKNTLIISSPGLGKTTMLRHLIRKFSHNYSGTSISVIDERNELSGSYGGIPQIDLGPRTDVFSGMDKEEGILHSVRSMAPKIIAVDEIGTEQEFRILQWAINSGVSIIATIHGSNVMDVKKKIGRELAEAFQCYILISERGKYQCF